MKIQLIAFDYDLNPNVKIDIVNEVVSSSDADLILFPGHTLRDNVDLDYLSGIIRPKGSTAVLELENAVSSSVLHTHNALFLLRGNKPTDMYTSQIFSMSEEVLRNKVLVEKLLDEMPRRKFVCGGKRITVLQCGETALLTCSRSEGNKASFRFKDDEILNSKYNAMLEDTDIFLNPIHTIQGLQPKMGKRREALSSDGRYYFSTCAYGDPQDGRFRSKSLQYAYFNGKPLSSDAVISEDGSYMSRIFEID